MANVKLNASAIGGVIQTEFSGSVAVASDGTVTVDTRDAPRLLALGCTYVNVVTKSQIFSPACRLGTAGRLVASAALSNGSLTIANQPDFPRQAALRIDPGAAAITAGSVSITYVANDGSTVTDVLTCVTGSAVLLTQNTTKGVVKINNAVVAGLAGGSSPKVELTDLNALAMVVDAGFVGFSVLKETLNAADESVGTVGSTAACVVPTTAPDGTRIFSFVYNYTMPST